ncbi:MAG: cell division protein FtsQ/DivIB [Gammaproteobacteria bacterium]|nr:cell division protein FtsQ/DivIB [Gammaproteobacteria bacterium]
MSVVSGEIRPRRSDARGGEGRFHRLRSRRTGIMLAIILPVMAGGLAVHRLLAPGRFPVRMVRFVGHFPRVPRDRLVAAVSPFMHANFYALDLAAVAAAVRTVPWAAHVSVTRRFPRTLDIVLRDQKLVAQWAGGGFVNARGAQIHLDGVGKPAGLPIFYGPKGDESQMLSRYQQFSTILAPRSLTITRLWLSARQAWRARLGDGVTIVLGRRPHARLVRLVQVFPQLAAQIPHMRSIDLRYTNGFAVRWRKGPGDTHG